MRLSRFYVNRPGKLDELWINGEEAHHILKVCRLREGDELVLFDGSGHEWLCEIVKTAKKRLLVRIENEKQIDRELKIRITIAAAVPKGKRAEIMIQKCAELGLHKFIPIKTAHSTIDVNEKQESRIERWKKICIEASKQSGRNRITEIAKPQEFSEVLTMTGEYDLPIIASPEGKSLKSVIGETKQIDTVLCMIGPEGGFTVEELEAAKAKAFSPVTIAPSILRVETAAIAITAMLAYSSSEM